MLTGVYYTCEVSIPALINSAYRWLDRHHELDRRPQGRPCPIQPMPHGMLGYHASKHGVVGLMRAYANCLASESIRVNTVHPTGVMTPMVVNEQFMQYAS